jgi:hypothetical protein
MTEYQWRTVSVVGFDELMQALDHADRKGYMPDAIKEDWEAFNWKPEQSALVQEPVGYADSRDLAKDGNWDTLIVKHASEMREGLRFNVPLYCEPIKAEAQPAPVQEPVAWAWRISPNADHWQFSDEPHPEATQKRPLVFGDTPSPAAQPAPTVQERCEYCDGTGDVHDKTGEWRGVCNCEAGKRLAAPVQEPDDDLTQALIERDEYHSIADQLAEVIAQITGADIGEHTSSNFPWHNALDAAKEWIATPPAAQPAPVQPVGVTTGCASHEGFFTILFRSNQPISDGTELYTTPPAQEIVCSTGLCHYRKPLTDEQVLDCWKQAYDPGRREHDNATRMARAVEAAHGIKGDA